MVESFWLKPWFLIILECILISFTSCLCRRRVTSNNPENPITFVRKELIFLWNNYCIQRMISTARASIISITLWIVVAATLIFVDCSFFLPDGTSVWDNNNSWLMFMHLLGLLTLLRRQLIWLLLLLIVARKWIALESIIIMIRELLLDNPSKFITITNRSSVVMAVIRQCVEISVICVELIAWIFWRFLLD